MKRLEACRSGSPGEAPGQKGRPEYAACLAAAVGPGPGAGFPCDNDTGTQGLPRVLFQV